MVFALPPGLHAPHERLALGFGTETPNPPPIGSWVEDLADDSTRSQPGAGFETPVQTRRASIDCERLSRKLSQLQVGSNAGAWPSAPPPVEPMTVDCARLSCETSGSRASSACVPIGTVGHPVSFSAPREHAGLPGGCRDAGFVAQRGPQEVAPSSASVAADKALTWLSPAEQASAGSRGHPGCCAGPCKYRKRKGGCRNGADCPDCHVCHWSRRPLAASSGSPAVPGGGRALPGWEPPVARAEPALALTAASSHHTQPSSREGPSPSELPASRFWRGGPCPDPGCPSLGSIGHPLCCGAPCKYVRNHGCKEGYNCKRCHFCKWHRYHGRQPAGQPAHGYQLEPRQHLAPGTWHP